MFEDFFKKPFTLDRIARITFAMLLIILLFWGLDALSTVLIPFALAWMVAYLLLPIVHFFEHKVKIKARWVNVLIVVLLLAGILTGVVALLIPSITEEAKKAWELIQYYDLAGLVVSIIPEELRSKSDFFNNLEGLLASFSIQDFISSIKEVFSKSWNIVQSTLNYLSGLVVIFLFFTYLIFILLDYEVLVKGVYSICPRSTRPFIRELAENLEYYINSYFRGQAFISLICGIILAIGFAIMGLPLGITFGLFVGMLNMIPYLQYIGYVPLVILVGLQSASTGQNFFVLLLVSIAIVLLSEVVQQVFLIPMIQGKSMGMKPAIILLSLAVWGSIFGFLGLLFALPLTMILYTFYMKYVIGEPISSNASNRKKKRANPSPTSSEVTNTNEEAAESSVAED